MGPRFVAVFAEGIQELLKYKESYTTFVAVWQYLNLVSSENDLVSTFTVDGYSSQLVCDPLSLAHGKRKDDGKIRNGLTGYRRVPHGMQISREIAEKTTILTNFPPCHPGGAPWCSSHVSAIAPLKAFLRSWRNGLGSTGKTDGKRCKRQRKS